MEPSTTVFEIMPSIVSNPVTEKRCPQTKAPFCTARVPFLDHPQDLPEVRSSLETLSRKLSCSGEYCAMCHI
jgi:hypothetical protein